MNNRLLLWIMEEEAKKVCAVSPSLFASLPPMPKDWKPPKEFLLRLGRPWEPDPWEYDDNPEDDSLFIQASQVVEQGEETSTSVGNHW